MTNKTTFEVKEGRTTIVVPHQGKELIFVAPHAKPSSYGFVGVKIDKAGLLRPTFAETVSLVYSATQNKSNRYAKQVLDILNNGRFWGFNGIRYEPKEGVFISDRNREEVHVPFGFIIGEQSLEELVKNPFVLALVEGEEGAEKLAKIAETGKNIFHYVTSFGSVDSPINRVPMLNSNCFGLMISDNGNNYGNCEDDGCAFGVLPKEETQ
jgi:hypothetical protein